MMFLPLVRIEKVRRMYLVVDIMCIAALHLVECVVVAIRESRRLRRLLSKAFALLPGTT